MNGLEVTRTPCSSLNAKLVSRRIHDGHTHQPRMTNLPLPTVGNGDALVMQEYSHQPISVLAKSGYQEHDRVDNSFRQINESGPSYHTSLGFDCCPQVPRIEREE